jgi:hypothetical protein
LTFLLSFIYFSYSAEVQIVELNPSEEFRAISLCGLDPETSLN